MRQLAKIEPMTPRFFNGKYRDCKWCGGAGCLSCPAEADKEYKRQFPDGPKPLLAITHEEFDHLEISGMTGGPSMSSAHGELGVLMQLISEAVRK